MKFGFGQKAEGKPGKLEEIKQKLVAMQAAMNGTSADKVGGGETIADDGGIPADKRNPENLRRIAEDEALVRGALALVGVDYDAMIAMDNASVYSKAVQANPEIVSQVMAAERPVLAALQVAMGFKPVAEFVGKYGSSPDEIRAAMRAEFEAEMAEKEAGRKVSGPVFSGTRAATKPAAAVKKGELTEVFGR